MNVLLDTCTFLWIISEPERLSPAAREWFTDPANVPLLSPVSTWEIFVKVALGKLPLPGAPEEYIQVNREAHHIESLPLQHEHVYPIAKLPPIHKDPFDRMLICQAIASGAPILTPDPAIRQYPVRTLW